MKNIIKISSVLMLLIQSLILQAQQNLNPSSLGFDDDVDAFVSDGTYTYVGGSFDFATINSAGKTGNGGLVDKNTGNPLPDFNGILRVSATGLLNGEVNAAIPDGNGGWFIGGVFNTVKGVTRNHIAHILADNTVDPAWDPDISGVNFAVRSLLLVGTDLYVGGRFDALNGGSILRDHIVRLDAATGAVDLTWDLSLTGNVVNALTSDGTYLYIGGQFSAVGGTNLNNLARVALSNGALDTWNPDASSGVWALLVEGPDLYVGGFFTTFNSGADTRNRLAKFDIATGNLDAWNPDANNTIRALTTDGTSLFAGGDFATFNVGADTRARLAKFNLASGNLETWDPGADGQVYTLSVEGNDLYVGGRFTLIGGVTRNYIAKMDAGTGTVDAGWNSDRDDYVNIIALGGANELFVGGEFALMGKPVSHIVRYSNATGDRDQNWLPLGADDAVYALQLTNDGFLVVGGSFTSIGGQLRNYLAKVNIATGLVDGWDPNLDSDVLSIAYDGSNLYVGGAFSTIQSGVIPRNGAAKFNFNGVLDPGWDPNANTEVLDIVVNGNDVYIGGGFTTLDGGAIPRNYIAKLDAATGGVDSWVPDSDLSSAVFEIDLSNAGLYVAGGISGVSGYIVRIDPSTGTVDPSFSPGVNDEVYAIAVNGDDIYIGGDFTQVNLTNIDGLAKLNASNGALDDTWNFDLVTRNVYELDFIGNDLMIGGSFNVIGNEHHPKLAIITFGDLALEQAGVPVVHFGTHDFGNVDMLVGSGAISFDITNAGGNDLALTGMSIVVVSGDDSGDFKIDESGATTPVAPGGSTSFTINFTPSALGVRSAQISIASSDLVENPYLITLRGTGVKVNQTVTFDALPVKALYDADFTVSASASSGLTGFTYISDDPAVATIAGNTVTINGVGTTNITATEVGDGNYNAASASQTLTVIKADQMITFNSLPVKTFGDADFTVSATSSTGLTGFAYMSDDTNVATISGNVVTIIGAGTATITATEAGDGNYNTASASQVLTVNKADQSITFDVIDEKNEDDQPFSLTGTASSGLMVSYTSSEPAVATVSGNTVTIVGPGTTNITASQPGNDNYNAASDVIQQLTVNMVTGLSEDIKTGVVIVYPNPGTGVFNLELLSGRSIASFQDIEIVIYNLIGETVYRQKINSGTTRLEIDISHLKDGLYFVKPQSDKTGFEILRIVKGK